MVVDGRGFVEWIIGPMGSQGCCHKIGAGLGANNEPSCCKTDRRSVNAGHISNYMIKNATKTQNKIRGTSKPHVCSDDNPVDQRTAWPKGHKIEPRNAVLTQGPQRKRIGAPIYSWSQRNSIRNRPQAHSVS